MIYSKEKIASTIQSCLLDYKKVYNHKIQINDYIYSFEDWKLPYSGTITAQLSDTNKDLIITESERSHLKKSKLLFDVRFHPNKQVVKVLLDPVHLFRTMISISSSNYIIEVMELNSEKVMTTVLTSLDRFPVFELHKDRILFISHTEDGRPNKISEKNFKQLKEKVCYYESRSTHQLKLIKTSLSNRSLFKNNVEYLLFSSEEKNPVQVIWSKKSGRIDHIIAFTKDSIDYILFVCRKEKSVNHKLILYNCNNKKYQIIPTRKNISITTIEANHTYIFLRYFNENGLNSGIISIENFVNAKIEFIEDTFSIPLQGDVHLCQNTNDESVTYLFCEDGCVSNMLYSYNPNLPERLVLVKNKQSISNLNVKKLHKKIFYVTSFFDEMKIPLTIYWKGDSKQLPRKQPGIIYVYGSYGSREQKGNLDPMMIAMIELGFVYCIAHVRGGGYLGEKWHRMGKNLNKWNSIHDFLDCCHYLIDEGIVATDRLSLISSSAGGIVAGASLNEEPNLFKSILLASPFIDPFNTMLYKRDYLSHMEVAEWGDPSTDLKIRKYIHSYSPMQNVKKAKGSKTNLFVICGENDKQISNEDVKSWLQKLQALGVTSHLEIHPKASHGGLPQGDIQALTKILADFLYSVINE